jgi:hypothetical protein
MRSRQLSEGKLCRLFMPLKLLWELTRPHDLLEDEFWGKKDGFCGFWCNDSDSAEDARAVEVETEGGSASTNEISAAAVWSRCKLAASSELSTLAVAE